MRTVEFNARLSSLAVVEAKGSQVLQVTVALPHSLEVLVALAGLLGQDVTVTIVPLRLPLDNASDRGVTIVAGGLAGRGYTTLG